MFSWLYRISDLARQAARRRSWPAEQAAGRLGEDLAHRYLERQGFTVVARNYRPPSGSGEIDLVAWDGDTLVFVEVKLRRSDEFGAPDRNVDREKQVQLLRAGRDYAHRAGICRDRVRFDLVSIVLARPPSVVHYRDAFRLETI